MRPLGSFGVLIAAIVLAACHDAGPTDVPSADRPRSSVTRLNGVSLVNTSSAERLRPASLGIALIGPEGGSIEVDGARFTVPPGALSQPVWISMYGKLNDQYRFRFGPNGLRFAVPATLTIAVQPRAIGIETARLAVAMASDFQDDWRVIGGSYDPATESVSVAVHHFTQYALCQN